MDVQTATALAIAAGLSYFTYQWSDQFKRAWRVGASRGFSRKLADAYNPAITPLVEPLPDECEVTEDELLAEGLQKRKLRYVIMAGKVKFGTAPKPSPANREIIDRWAREYMQGQHGSLLKMPVHQIIHWVDLVVQCILTPTAGAIATRELMNQRTKLVELEEAYAAASSSGSFWKTLFGRDTRPSIA